MPVLGSNGGPRLEDEPSWLGARALEVDPLCEDDAWRLVEEVDRDRRDESVVMREKAIDSVELLYFFVADSSKRRRVSFVG